MQASGTKGKIGTGDRVPYNVSPHRRSRRARKPSPKPQKANSRARAPASLYTTNAERKYLNRQERALALAAFAGLPPEKRLFALTLAWSGGRVSEVLALTPASFQIGANLVAIRTLKRRVHVVREVFLPPSLVRAIDEQFGIRERQRDPALRTARLWPFCRQTAWRIIKTVLESRGLYGVAASPRGLRHAFGAANVQAGVPIGIMKKLLGHARLDTTLIYTDLAGPEELAFARRVWRRAA